MLKMEGVSKIFPGRAGRWRAQRQGSGLLWLKSGVCGCCTCAGASLKAHGNEDIYLFSSSLMCKNDRIFARLLGEGDLCQNYLTPHSR